MFINQIYKTIGYPVNKFRMPEALYKQVRVKYPSRRGGWDT
jgi:hypothetical protein